MISWDQKLLVFFMQKVREGCEKIARAHFLSLSFMTLDG